MTYYIGTNPGDVNSSFIKRYFYGLRRNVDGELFLISADQLSGEDNSITINDLGESAGNFPYFEEGIDYLDGITDEHILVYENLRYPQMKWDGRFLVYYVDDDGQLTVRINKGYNYPTGISAEGY